MLVKLLTDKHYPAAWVFNWPALKAGSIVPVSPATNIPDSAGKYWIDTPELIDDAYGILFYPGEYEEVRNADL